MCNLGIVIKTLVSKIARSEASKESLYLLFLTVGEGKVKVK